MGQSWNSTWASDSQTLSPSDILSVPEEPVVNVFHTQTLPVSPALSITTAPTHPVLCVRGAGNTLGSLLENITCHLSSHLIPTVTQ